MLRYSKSRDQAHFRAEGSRHNMNRDSEKFIMIGKPQLRTASSFEPTLADQIQQIQAILRQISRLLLSFNIRSKQFTMLSEKYDLMAVRLIQSGIQSLNKKDVGMAIDLIKQVRKQQKKRKKLEKDLDNLFEGARDTIVQKQQSIKQLEQVLIKCEEELTKKDQQIQEQSQIIKTLQSKMDKQDPISKYLPSQPMLQSRQVKSSIKSEQLLKPPLPSSPKQKGIISKQCNELPNLNISTQLSSDLVRMLLIQAAALQSEMEREESYLIQ